MIFVMLSIKSRRSRQVLTMLSDVTEVASINEGRRRRDGACRHARRSRRAPARHAGEWLDRVALWLLPLCWAASTQRLPCRGVMPITALRQSSLRGRRFACAFLVAITLTRLMRWPLASQPARRLRRGICRVFNYYRYRYSDTRALHGVVDAHRRYFARF